MQFGLLPVLLAAACSSNAGGGRDPGSQTAMGSDPGSGTRAPKGAAAAGSGDDGGDPDAGALDAANEGASADARSEGTDAVPRGAVPVPVDAADADAADAANADGGVVRYEAGSAAQVDAAGTGTDGAGTGAPGAQNDADAGPPGVRIVGRTVMGTSGPRFEWPGVHIAARFQGTQVSVQLSDGNNQNEFEVIVDGTRLNKLVTKNGVSTYTLARGLANGPHDLVLWRRTESYYNATEFLGFTGWSAGGGLLPPAPAPDRRIEIVGDSISVGYGIEGTSSCTSGQLETIENNYLAYGPVAARMLGADVVTTAWSGKGVYRNYSQPGPSSTDPTLPQLYDWTLAVEAAPAWDFAGYVPQAVVINLGTNDFSTMGDPGQPYVDALVAFEQHIRSKYPQAFIILAIQFKAASSDQAPDVASALSTIQAAGDTNVESFDLRPFSNSSGCQGHPDVAGGQAMGAALAAEIQRVMNW